MSDAGKTEERPAGEREPDNDIAASEEVSLGLILGQSDRLAGGAI